MVVIPARKSHIRPSVKTLRILSLTYHVGNIFNLLPLYIRDFVGETATFKTALDEFLT